MPQSITEAFRRKHEDRTSFFVLGGKQEPPAVISHQRGGQEKRRPKSCASEKEDGEMPLLEKSTKEV